MQRALVLAIEEPWVVNFQVLMPYTLKKLHWPVDARVRGRRRAPETAVQNVNDDDHPQTQPEHRGRPSSLTRR